MAGTDMAVIALAGAENGAAPGPGVPHDPLAAIGERIGPVPAPRLGSVLCRQRDLAGLSVDDAAAASGLSSADIEDIETGRSRPDPATIAGLLAVYGADIDELLPPRKPLVVTEGTDAEVLERYLAAFERWRGPARGGRPPRFRRVDLDVLAGILGTDPRTVQARLMHHTGCSRRRARRFTAMFLVGLAAVPVVVGVAQGVAHAAPVPAPATAPAAASVTAPVARPGAVNPFATMPLWVNPSTPAAAQAAAWRVSDPADAATMARLAATPTSTWFGSWTPAVTAAVHSVTAAAAAAHRLPVLVAYDIYEMGGTTPTPGFTAGAASPAAYQAWIRAFAAGIDGHAVVVLEPDALAQLGGLSPADQATRLGLLRDAVSVLSADPDVAVYIDAGNAAWESVPTMAARLEAAGVASARGFSLNVANFDTTAGETAYGDGLSAALGGAHYIVDTSRNGRGAGSSTFNPAGRALGPAPTTATGHPAADAFVWVKYPGRSDGPVNGGPPAGTWWPAYALGLARAAGWA